MFHIGLSNWGRAWKFSRAAKAVLLLAAVAVLVIAGMFILGGCSPSELTPAKSMIRESVTVKSPDGTVTTRTREIESTGVGVKGDSGKITADAIKAPVVQAGPKGLFAGGGGIDDLSISGVVKSPMAALYVIAGLSVLAGVILCVLKLWNYGLAAVAGGVVLMATCVLFDRYPWVVLIGLAAVVGGAGWIVYKLWHSHKTASQLAGTSATLETVVAGVQQAEPGSGVVKAAIAATAAAKGIADTVKSTVKAVKTKLGL